MKKAVVLCLILALGFGMVFAQGSGESGAAAQASSDPKAAWPTKDVKIIVPNPAGGASDMGARLFAEYVSKNSGKNVIIVNETGGGNTVGFETVRNARPDGTTLLSFHSTALLNYYSGKIKYSVLDEKAYTFINLIYEPDLNSVNCIAVSAKSPYKTMQDLIAAAKANPGTVSCGDGFGSSAAVVSGQIEIATGVKFKHVDAPDSTTRITSIIGGQIDWAPLGYKQAKAYVDSGDMRLLAMDGSYNDFDKSIPTLESLGINGVGFPAYGFVAGPVNMDPAVVNAIDLWCQEFAANSAAAVEKIGFTSKAHTRAEALKMENDLAASTQQVTKALGWN